MMKMPQIPQILWVFGLSGPHLVVYDFKESADWDARG